MRAEGGEMEKEMGGKHQCEHCGKNYVYKHKLAHHKTWLCKEAAPTLVQVEPRRKLSSNVPTIPEREDRGEGWRMEPNERGDQGEGGLAVGLLFSSPYPGDTWNVKPCLTSSKCLYINNI